MNTKLSNEQIHEIAENIDTGIICFLNGDTGETVFMMNNEMLSNYGISWEDEWDEDEDIQEGMDKNCQDWQKEMYTDIKADMAKIESWEKIIRIEKPDSNEAFDFMERFVDEVIPEGKLKKRFWEALSRSHPFRNFNNIVHNCEYREAWFAFKNKELEKYVREAIGDYGFNEE